MTLGQDVDAPHLLLGRSRQLTDFAARLPALEAGRGGLLWVRGEAGIGKTSLLAAIDRRCSSRATVLHGRGWEDSSTPPFWLWTQVLREAADGRTSSELGQAWGAGAAEAIMLLDGSGLGAAPNRFPLFDSVATVLFGLARRRPLVVLLDDVHWADDASLKLLRFMAGDLAHQPVQLVCAWRDQEALHGEQRHLDLDLALGDEWRLGGLDTHDTAALIEAASGLLVSEDDADAVRERTGGNPLFVAEMARLAGARGSERVSSVVPDSAQATIRRRVARLNQQAYELLVAAAVLGDPMVEDLAAVTGRSRAELGPDLGLIQDAGLVTVAGEQLAFAHALIRHAVYDAIAPARRTQLHLRAAEVLSPGGVVPDHRAAEVTHHLTRALPLADPARLIDVTRQAARVAGASQAWEEAARLHRQLVGIVAPGSPERPRILVQAGEALLDAGDLEGARSVYVEAAELARSAGDGEAFARAALGFAAGLSGFEVRLFDRTQNELLEEALRRLPEVDSTLRAAVLARLSVGLSFAESPARREELAVQAVAMAERLGDQMTLGVALSAVCDAKAGPDFVEFRDASSSRIIEVARATGDPALELLGLRLRIVARLESGQMPLAFGDMRSYETISDRLRQPLYSWFVPLWRGLRAHLAGDVAQVEACAAEAARIGALADSDNAEMLALVQRSWAKRVSGGVSDGLRLVLEGLGPLLDQNPEIGALMALLPDRPPAVRAAAIEGLSAVIDGLVVDKEWVPNLAHLVECVQETETRDPRLVQVYDALAPYAHLCSVDGIGAAQMGSVERYLGILAALLGRPEADRHFEAAIRANQAIGALPLALTQRAYAEHLTRRGEAADDTRRHELLESALEFYRTAGVAERVAELSSLLADQPLVVPQPRTGSSWRRQGQVWALEFRGTGAHVPMVKGMADLAVLLARPGTEVHVLDLVGGGTSVHQHDLGEVIDDRARTAYRQRLEQLDAELDAADSAGDEVAGARAQAERDAILHELGAATGLAGRRRTTGDGGERARTTVTSRIKDAIKRIDEVHPELARHLRASVRTGTFCSYVPEQTETWEVDPTT